MSAPLDLEQFGPTLANPDAAALLEECRRQRAEIERLRAALEGTIQPMILLGDFIGNEFDGKVGIPAFDRCAAIRAARVALQESGGAA